MKSPASEADDLDLRLQREALMIGKYLLGKVPVEPVIERYILGAKTLFRDLPQSLEIEIEVFLRRHPGTLPFLDAACALFYPKRLLRNKIILMVALTEATPEYCDEFFPSTFSKLSFLWTTITLGVTTIVNAAVGGILLAWISLKRS